MKKPIAWAIAGSDSSAGAGVQADLATFSDLGVHGCNVVTSITAQNSFSVTGVKYCDPDLLDKQIEALNADFPTEVIKIGMLGSSSAINVVAKYLERNKKIVICDPVLSATGGRKLLEEGALIHFVSKLFPQISLLTPNIQEAERFLNISIRSHSDVKIAAKKILDMGVESVLIKGWNAGDYFLGKQGGFWLQSMTIYKDEVHGTGCILSSAITAAMALGYDLYDALVIGKMYVTQEIRHAVQIGKGSLLITHQGWPKRSNDLPWISSDIKITRFSFPTCGSNPIGFYPIVDSVFWVERLIKLGVTSIQLRIKNQSKKYIENAIKKAVFLTKKNNIRLFINDYWDLAIQYKAYGVHLGQEDLKSADLSAIHKSGLRLGISTHCFYEVASAHTYRPSYIAFGPIYTTTSKPMSFSPRGLKQLRYWRLVLKCPLVAIGGITLVHLPEILATGIDGVSVISAITKSSNLEQEVRLFLETVGKKYA